MTGPSKFLIQLAGNLLLCFLCTISYGQTKNIKGTKIYFQSAIGATNHNGFSTELGIDGVFKNKWIASLSYNSVNMDPKNLPDDFIRGSGIVLFIPFKDEKPVVNTKTISFAAGRYFQVSGNSWFTTEAGLSFVSGNEINFSKQPGGSYNGFLSSGTRSNYSFEEKKKTAIGAMLRANVNCLFTSFLGVGLDVFSNFNSIQSTVGVQIKFYVGPLNLRRK